MKPRGATIRRPGTTCRSSALALYTGQTDVARTTLEGSRADIGGEFEPDGSQPRELARTRAWDYSIFDLTAFLHLAAMGERVGVDLWNYSTADGRSLRQGVEYLIPFATGEKRFPARADHRIPSIRAPSQSFDGRQSAGTIRGTARSRSRSGAAREGWN